MLFTGVKNHFVVLYAEPQKNMHTHTLPGVRWMKRALATLALVLLSLPLSTVEAATTLLVNTESFLDIDSGDGTTNKELRFGSSTQTLKFLTTNKFQFSHSLSVLGNLSGSTLNVDGNAGIY